RSEDTDEFPALSNTLPGPFEASFSSQVQVEVAAQSHTGLVRSNNEDHFLTARFGRWFETLHTNMPDGLGPRGFEDVRYGIVVADGMGGAAAGEVASRVALSKLMSLALSTPDWILQAGKNENQRVMQRMSERIHEIDVLLHELAESDPNLYGMGTTITL